MMQVFVPWRTIGVSVCIDCGDPIEPTLLILEPTRVRCGSCAEAFSLAADEPAHRSGSHDANQILSGGGRI